MTRLGLSCTVGIVAAIGMLAGCGKAAQTLPFGQSGASLSGPAAIAGGKIKHIIYIVQEGRSFDNLFQSYPGADTVSQGMNSEGKTIALQPWSLKKPYRIDDSADAMFAACNGAGRIPGTDCKMNGFNNELSYGGPPNPQYVYVPHGESKPYFEMAHEWVVGDKMFASQLDQSYTAHQYVIAAQAGRAVDIPFGTWGCDGPEGDTIATLTNRRTFGPTEFPCFDYQTLGGELEKAGLSWRNYASATGVDGYASIKGSYWQAHVVKRPQQILKDVANGDLASFTWVMPPNCLDSDAGGCAGGYGPSWVAAVVNTVGKSKFWDSTAIFVQWSDWGGFYDHVAPAYSNFDSVGFRVPLLVISPYAKQDYVSHVHYETASVLRFAEDVYGLDRLAAADKRAASPAADCFDFSQKARAFVPIKAPKGIKFFLHQRS